MRITEFLLARIAEDEHRLDLPEALVVLNSHGEVSARGDGWVSRGECPVCGAHQYDGTESVTEDAWWEHAETVHQRARVLAECAAKRRIVETLTEHERSNWDYPGSILELLAQPYVDHLDYDEAWRP